MYVCVRGIFVNHYVLLFCFLKDAPIPTWENLEAVMKAVQTVVEGLVDFIQHYSHKKHEPANLHNTKYKTNMCRDLTQKGSCPRAANCTFAHSQDEMEK